MSLIDSQIALRIAKKNYLNLKARIARLGNHEQKAEKIISEDEYLKLYEQENCTYCNYKFVNIADRCEIDHVVAFERGGITQRRNLNIACSWCNRAKRQDDLETFLYWLNGLKAKWWEK
jgi:5-methylcytosine-specific restriction endonuclease McrA